MFKNNNFIELCDNEWEYYSEKYSTGYRMDVSNLQFKEGSLRNILMNLNNKDSIIEIRIHDINNSFDRTFVNKNNKNFKTIDVGDSGSGDKCECEIIVDLKNMCVKIIPSIKNKTIIESNGENGERIEDLFVDVTIDDEKDISNTSSIGLKEYFSIFNLISMSKIKENINNDNNIKYYSTVDDNKYKIRVIEPDSIEVKDIYEAMPMKISQNNRSVVGTIKIRRKNNVDKIGLKIVNRYSGFYNPIFNDILYYDDYSYVKYVSELSYNVELPYSNTNIDYNYDDGYGKFGVIKNMYYHKTNVLKSNKILSITPIYPAINEYALGYRDYNVFSSNWDEGYFMSQDDLNNASKCSGIGSMKEGLCMFGSKYLNIPDDIFIDTFENGKLFDDRIVFDIGEDMNSEILYKEINNRTVQYNLFIEKRLKRYLKESLLEVFSKYINKKYSFGNKGTIEDDVDEYVEKNLLKLYKVDKVYLYIKDDRVRLNDKKIENEYLRYMDKNNELKIKNGFPVIEVDGGMIMKDSRFIMGKINEFDRSVTYNLKAGFKESFGFGVSFKRK
jgi:hypothetical protein